MSIACHYLCLFTENLNKSRAFYEVLLEMQLIKQTSTADACVDFYQLTPQMQLAIWLRPSFDNIPHRSTSMICLNFADHHLIEQKLDVLSTFHATLIEPLHKTSYGQWRCIVEDPNGQYWEWCAPILHL